MSTPLTVTPGLAVVNLDARPREGDLLKAASGIGSAVKSAPDDAQRQPRLIPQPSREHCEPMATRSITLPFRLGRASDREQTPQICDTPQTKPEPAGQRAAARARRRPVGVVDVDLRLAATHSACGQHRGACYRHVVIIEGGAFPAVPR